RRSALSRSSSRPMRRHPSPELHFRSTAGGPRTDQASKRFGWRPKVNKMVDIASAAPAAAVSPSTDATAPAPRQQQIVVVFQGGGALGAYQAGVFQALYEAGIEPDWLVGTSIGAINASIIAGNEPADRLAKLQEFWRRITRRDMWRLSSSPGVSDFAGY